MATIGLIETTGSSLQRNFSGLDVFTCNYVCSKDTALTLAPKVGDAYHTQTSMGAKSVNVTMAEGFASIVVSYEGFWDSTLFGGIPKEPVGGASLSAAEQPIMTHPNYTKKEGTSWGTVFGDGPSPNAFGRVLDGGMFKAFGPVPVGGPKTGRPKKSDDKDAYKLIGVESFLSPGAGSYKYTQVGSKSIAKWDSLAKIITPTSAKIPVPSLSNDRNWLLAGIQESIQQITSAGAKAYSVSLDWMGSGDGGWNELIYQKAAGTYKLD